MTHSSIHSAGSAIAEPEVSGHAPSPSSTRYDISISIRSDGVASPIYKTVEVMIEHCANKCDARSSMSFL
jgi:hypothetical protein